MRRHPLCPPSPRRRLLLPLLLALALLAAGPRGAQVPAADEAPDGAAAPIYLRGPERLRMQGRVEHLTVADFNGDGRPDFAAYNPTTSLLVVSYSAVDAERRSEEFRLEGDGDWTWRERKIVLAQRITAMAAADFDGDGRTDLAFGSQSDEGGLLLQGDDGLEDQAEPLPAAARQVVAGDLDKDGRADLLLGAKDGFVVLRQGPRGLEVARRLASSAEPTERLTLHDLDGDGSADLLFADPQDRTYVVVRFGLADGSFGPEHRHRLGDHAFLSPLPGGRIAWLDPATRAITVAALQTPERAIGADRLEFGDPENLPLPGEYSGSRLAMTVAPVAEPGAPADVFVSLDKAAEVLRLQRDQSGHLSFDRIPSFAGVTQLVALPAGADDTFGQGPVLYQVSESEKVLAHASLASADAAREFPRPVGVEDTTLAIAAGPFDAEHPAALFLAFRPGDDEDEDVNIAVVRAGEHPETLASFPLDDTFDAKPVRLVAADFNHDGRGDVLVFFDFDDPRLYLADADGAFSLFAPRGGLGPGLLAKLKPLDLAVGDVDADGQAELVVARENFVRVYHLAASGDVTIKHQFNPATRGRALTAPVLAQLDDDAELEILVTQLGGDRILAFDLAAPDRQREAPAPKIEPLAAASADVSGDGRPDLVLLADKRLAVFAGGGRSRTFVTLSRTLTTVRDGLFGRIATGALEGAGSAPILMAVEVRENALEFFEVSDGGDLSSRYRFKVFNAPGSMDERRLRRTDAEPRDLIVADVDGDGREDLVALAHENLLIYRRLDAKPGS